MYNFHKIFSSFIFTIADGGIIAQKRDGENCRFFKLQEKFHNRLLIAQIFIISFRIWNVKYSKYLFNKNQSFLKIKFSVTIKY